uniref:Uncharacterized protein n=1 Tax=Lepeophtheirus salmonis TaxID=72036 RepID=A0A0K2TA98_LEPSM
MHRSTSIHPSYFLVNHIFPFGYPIYTPSDVPSLELTS